MTQAERIVQYMITFGSITTMEAFQDLGITKLATRISEMIQEGVKIDKKSEKGKNRYGETIYYTRYFLG